MKISIIIPSHNRCESLSRVLTALGRQSFPAEAFEVIVVLDGTTDNSAALLTSVAADKKPGWLSWITQPQQGQAAARNNGARRARGEVLVFLDDDIVPDAELLSAHWRWHQERPSRVILGYCPLIMPAEHTFYDRLLWMWWEDMYYARSRPGRQSQYHDCCAGNLSLRRDDFIHVGGFDPDFQGYGGEDYDLGYRLLAQGMEFIIDQQARAEHFHRGSTTKFIRQMRSEGKNDVLLGKKHPALRPGLRLAGRPQRMRLLFYTPTFCRLLLFCSCRLLNLYERLKLFGTWRRLFGTLRHCAYWLGVQEQFKHWAAFERYLADIPEPPQQTIDITQGLPASLPDLNRNGPQTLIITADGMRLGAISIAAPHRENARQTVAAQIAAELSGPLWSYLAEKNIPVLKTETIPAATTCPRTRPT